MTTIITSKDNLAPNCKLAGNRLKSRMLANIAVATEVIKINTATINNCPKYRPRIISVRVERKVKNRSVPRCLSEQI